METGRELSTVFLDFDGTLVNSIPVCYKAYLEFMADHGLQGTEEEFASLLGPSLPEIVDHLKDKYGLLAPTEDLCTTYTERLSASYLSAEPFPHARDCLHWLQEQSVQVFIVTSSIAHMVDAYLHKQELRPLVEKIVTAEDLEYSKPHPAIYEKAWELSGAKKESCLAVEDSAAGMDSALGAGIPVVLITHEQASTSSSTSASSFPTAKDWRELQSYMEARLP